MQAGQTLLHYRIVEKIGEGGMGVVWKAHDTTLNRDVAIKVLPDDIAADPERLSRFEREARLLAALNHPNIAAVHGLHHASTGSGHPEVHFIVMELVEGETLAERLGRGALSLDDTLEVTRQISEALEAAHDRGIVHRDLKPANIKLRPDGKLSVLDFGLARAVAADLTDSESHNAATITTTRAGAILGTAPYMSPEQARGKPVCKRTDIWALGCVLYECLTGRRPFDGATTTDVLAQIVSQEPDLSVLSPSTPPFLLRSLRRCLEKEPRRRLRDAGELRVAIETFRSDPAADSLGGAAPTASRSPASWLPWTVVAALAIALIYVMAGGLAGKADVGKPLRTSRWTIPLPAETRVDLPGPGGKFDYSRLVAISRDGSRIAFSVLDEQNHVQLYLKADAAEPVPIPGTTDARAPFFSPDGMWLGFYLDGKVWKVALSGGSPQELCEIRARAIAFDASWAPDGRSIVYTDGGLWRVTVADGATHELTRPDPARDELGHNSPRFTPDGRGILFTVTGPGGTHLAWMPAAGGDWEILVRDAALGAVVGSDRLVFARTGELFAAPFDAETRRVTGSAVSVLTGVHTAPGLGGMVVTWYDVSESGDLVYVPADTTRPDEQLLWVDLDGNETLIAEGPGTWVHPRLSPDRSRISLDIHTDDGMRDIYVYQLQRGQFQQLTHTGVSWESEWRPDGEYVAILSGMEAGQWSLYQVRTDFSGPPELLARTDHAIPGSWLDEGRALLYTEWKNSGIYRLQVGDEAEPQLLLRTEQQQAFPRISPNGKWVAYTAVESSRREVFVQSYPALGETHKISIDGGREPVWSRDGKRLFYRSGNRMLLVEVGYSPSISFSAPRVLFEGVYDGAVVGHQHFDVSHDGNRLLMVRHGEPQGPREVRVVLNWGELLAADSPL